MQSIRWGLLAFVCIIYGVAATILIALGAFTIVVNLADESLEAWAGASVGVGLIGAGSFALVVRLLAFIANAVAERNLR